MEMIIGLEQKPGEKKFNIQSSRTEQMSEIMTPALYRRTIIIDSNDNC